MRRERSGGGCAGSSALISTVPAVALRLMGNQGMRAKHEAHRSSRVLLPGLFNHRGIGWVVSRSHASRNVWRWVGVVVVVIRCLAEVVA